MSDTDYRTKDWSAIPCKTRDMNDKSSWKRPAVNWGNESNHYKGDWKNHEWGDCNVALIIPKGFVIIDIDSEEALQRFAARDDVIDTYTVKSPNGYHLYYMTDEDVGTQVAGKTGMGVGIDIRIGGDGIITAPYLSKGIHKATGEVLDYMVVNDVDIAALPPTMAEDLRYRENSPITGSPSVSDYQIPQGQRNDTLVRYCGAIVNRPVSFEAAFNAVMDINNKHCSPPLPPNEIEAMVKQYWRETDNEGELNVGRFVKNGKSHLTYLEKAVTELGYEISNDVRGRRAIFRKDEGEWSNVDDSTAVCIRREVLDNTFSHPYIKSVLDTNGKAQYKLRGMKLTTRFTQKDSDEVFKLMGEGNKRDFFKDYLDGLPEWDNTPRVEGLMETLYDVRTDKILAKYGISATLVACVGRTYEPGKKFDIMTVLVGKQGIGKSAFWRLLLPDEDMFSDSLNISADDKTLIETLRGKVIVENGELNGLRKADANRLKGFLTRQVDSCRPAYARHPEDNKRMCVIVGTTNEGDFLSVDGGENRRFLPIEVAPSISGDEAEKYLNDNRDQIWAEALKLYRDGFNLEPTKEMKQRQAATNATRAKVDEFIETSVMAFIDTLIPEDYCGQPHLVTNMTDVVNGSGIAKQFYTTQQVGEVLRREGFVNKVNKRRVWVRWCGESTIKPLTEDEK